MQAVESALQQQLQQLGVRLECMEQEIGLDGTGTPNWRGELQEAVEHLQEEARWVEEEGIRLRVEDEAHMKNQLEQIRQMNARTAELLTGRLEALELAPQAQQLSKLEQELKAAHQASLRALEAKGQVDLRSVEQRLGQLVDRIAILEVTVKNEQEASLMALEAILDTNKGNSKASRTTRQR